MATSTINLKEVHEPSARESDAARTAANEIARFDHRAKVGLVVEQANDAGSRNGARVGPITIPAGMVRAIVDMLVEIGNGNAVAVVPVSVELTTQQAAGLLNISRTHLITLLKNKAIPYRMVGTHRKLLARDVLIYRDRAPARRRGRARAAADA